jgi:Uma2 family endonuclease
MLTLVPKPLKADTDVFYPIEDGEPLAESSVHVDAILMLIVLLRQYLQDHFLDHKPLILANQFVYYAENFPRLRFAPDVAVVFGVEPGPRDNYKIWEEKQVPAVIFEITSPGTQKEDKQTKKDLYAKIGVLEYWLFDPKAEWIPEQLRGYCLEGETYHPITDRYSQVLSLHLEPEGALLGLYRSDTGEKLPLPSEVADALKISETNLEQERQRTEQERQRAEQERQRAEQERQRAEQERQQAEQERQRAERLAEQLRQLGVNPDRF